MKALYFPDSCIPERIREILGSCFKGTGVFMPSCDAVSVERKDEAEDGIVPIVPEEGQRMRVESFLREYRQWAGFHNGRAGDYINGLSEPVPFSDEGLAFHLRDEIKGRLVGSSAEDTADDSLLSARAYLQAARDLDMEICEIDRELERLSGRESLIFNELAGGETDGGNGSSAAIDCREETGYDPQCRLSAWSRVFVRGEEASAWGDTPLFITEKKSVMGYLIERGPEVELVATVPLPPDLRNKESVGAWCGDFRPLVESFCAGNSVADDLKGAVASEPYVSLYRIRNVFPREFFKRFIQEADKKDHGSAKEAEKAPAFIVIALIGSVHNG